MSERIDGLEVITDRAPPVRTTPSPTSRLDVTDAPEIPARFTPERAEPRWTWERDPTTASHEVDPHAVTAEASRQEGETTELVPLDPPTDEVGAAWFDGSLEAPPAARPPQHEPHAAEDGGVLTWHVPAAIGLTAVAMVVGASVLALVW